jgi:hypothetical protein
MASRVRRHESADPDRLIRILTERLDILLWTTDRAIRLTSVYDASRRKCPEARKSANGGDFPDPAQTLADAHRQALLGHHVALEFERGIRTYGAIVGPLHDRKGRLIGTIGIAIDTTEA